MEKMKSPKWSAFIKKEQENWGNAIADKSSQIHRIQKILSAAKATSEQMRFGTSSVSVAHIGTMAYLWKFKFSGEEKPSLVSDICVKGDTVWVIEEHGDGEEVYVVCCYKRGSASAEPVWTSREHGVAAAGPFVAVVGGRCYSVEAKNHLVYYRCVSWDAETGRNRRIEYEEKDYRYNLEIIRGENCLFLRRQSGPKQDVMQITEDGAAAATLLAGISEESRRFVLGGGVGEYLLWTKPTGWKASPTLLERNIWFPNLSKAVPEELDSVKLLLITRWYGMRILWKLRIGAPAIQVWQGIGKPMLDPLGSNWIRFPGLASHASWWRLSNAPAPNVISSTHNVFWQKTHSKDGTLVPFVMIVSKGSAAAAASTKGLLVSAYSAYGLPSMFSTARFAPLLSEGWAICFPMYRGGGDHTPEWEDAGRLDGRENVLEDAEAVVIAARRLVKVPAERTVIYGRSAGGLWVGGLCSRFPNGELFGGAYMEVPYLDVLRTITNRSLPLTNLETDEFGLPEQRLSDFASALRWSPMETLGEEGTPGIWQIVRTGLNDSQVFAYESAKWVMRSRSMKAKAKAPIYLAINGGQGHFVFGSTGLEQQAEDLAVMIDLVKNRRS
jgi:hypothetical protein